MFARRSILRPLLVGGLALTFLSCAVNPATGRRELSFISESQEIQMGRDADPQIVASMGLVDDAALQSYISDIGMPMARDSERPDLPWTFRVVDDPTVNAFAVPGGFVYVTRGILGYMNSEAEIAGILGHEIGHITAKHSVNQMSRTQLAQLGLGVGMILSEDIRNYGDVAGAGIQVLSLKFGRDDERESDALGFRYMTAHGYNPGELANVFRTLDRLQPPDGRIPGWLSTHPNPADRQVEIGRMIQSSARSFDDAVVGRDRFLAAIDGMVFGANPREGFFEGSLFRHPELAFQIRFPDGWQTVNQKQAVVGVSAEQNALMVLELADEATPADAVAAFGNQDGVTLSSTSSESVNGLPARRANFRFQSPDQRLDGSIVAVAYGGSVYMLLGYGTQSGWSSHGSTVRSALLSFRQETDSATLAVQPDRIEVVRIPRAMSIEEFHRDYPSAVPVDQLALINGVQLGDRFASGTRVKRIVSGR